MPGPNVEAFTTGLVQAAVQHQLADGEDAIVLNVTTLPHGFNMLADLVPIGRALTEGLADRPEVRLVRLVIPGARVPLDIPLTPRN